MRPTWVWIGISLVLWGMVINDWRPALIGAIMIIGELIRERT